MVKLRILVAPWLPLWTTAPGIKSSSHQDIITVWYVDNARVKHL